MGTRNNPGKFDCYHKADPDEPMFVLLGRDPAAPLLILLWADIRTRMLEDPEKIQEAQDCAKACFDWLCKLEKQVQYEKALQALDDSISERTDELLMVIKDLLELLGPFTSTQVTEGAKKLLKTRGIGI